MVIALGTMVAQRYFRGEDSEFPESGPELAAESQSELGAPQSGLGIADLINVAGRFGAPPVVGILGPMSLGSMKVATILEGDGRRIEEGTPVLTQVYRFSGEDGSATGPVEFLIGRADPEDLGEELTSIVIGHAEGTRLLVVRPLEDGLCEIAVVDILSTIAVGEVVEDPGGPLTVEVDDEAPRVTHKKTPPQQLSVQTLIRGTGPQVQLGDRILAHYSMSRWSDEALVASSWGEGLPAVHQLDDMWPGLIDALVDQRVGSRLAVTIPPDQANGEDTIVAVIDILGTVHSTDQ